MSSIRKYCFVGIIDYDIFGQKGYLHFSEYFSGEGLDFTFSKDKEDDIKFSLNLDEIFALSVAAYSSGYLDLKEVKKESKRLLQKSVEREQEIDRFREDYQERYSDEKESTKKKKCTGKNCSCSCLSSANC